MRLLLLRLAAITLAPIAWTRGAVFEEYDMPGVTMRNSIATGGGAKTAWFKDTEGNILAISQRL
jgi:hypothetical protein